MGSVVVVVVALEEEDNDFGVLLLEETGDDEASVELCCDLYSSSNVKVVERPPFLLVET